MEEVRQAILRITPVLLGEFLRSGERHFSVEGLPEDAEFVAASYNHIRRCFEVMYRSKQFNLVEEGQECPVLKPPTIKRLKEKVK